LEIATLQSFCRDNATFNYNLCLKGESNATTETVLSAFTDSWYVQFGKRQVNLGKVESAAWEKYHELMADRGGVENDPTVYQLANTYLTWVQTNRAAAVSMPPLSPS